MTTNTTTTGTTTLCDGDCGRLATHTDRVFLSDDLSVHVAICDACHPHEAAEYVVTG